MSKSNKFSPEVRERAVRMVQEHRGEYPSLWAAIESIAPKIGCVPQTLNEWVKRAEVDTGVREGVTTSEAQRVKDLERDPAAHQVGNDAVCHRHRGRRHPRLGAGRHDVRFELGAVNSPDTPALTKGYGSVQFSTNS
jgi:transposase